MKRLSVIKAIVIWATAACFVILTASAGQANNPKVEFYLKKGPNVPSVVLLECSGKCELGLYSFVANKFHHLGNLKTPPTGGVDGVFFAKPVDKVFYFLRSWNSTTKLTIVPFTDFPTE